LKNKSGNKNIKKKLLRVFLYLILVIAILPVSLSLLFQSPVVQTISARLASDILSKNIEQEISITSIKISFFDGLEIKGLDVRDHHNNTLLGVGNLLAIPVFSDLSLQNIAFISIAVDSAQFNMGSYKGEDNSNLNMMIKQFTSSNKSSDDRGKFRLFSKKIILKNSRFNLFNQNREYSGGERTMDYANILIEDINTEINNFTLINDSLSFKIIELNAKEKCGLVVKKFSTDFIISSTGMYTKSALVEINNSNLDIDFSMHYSNYQAMSYYIDSVTMKGTVRPTMVDMADIGHFSDILFQMPNIVGVTGNVEGTVRELSGTEIRVKYGNNTRVSGDIMFKGLPDFFTSYMVGQNLRITSNSEDIGNFFLPIQSKHIDVSNIIPKGEQITVEGNFDGYYEDFTSKLDLFSEHGNISSEIDFEKKNGITSISTSTKADSLNIGDLLGMNNTLGLTSFNVGLDISGATMEDFDYTVKGKFYNTDILNYNYKRFGVDVKYFDDSISGNLRVGDHNLMMESSLVADLKNEIFDINANIVKANLTSLTSLFAKNINIASTINANIKGTDLNTLNADILLSKNTLTFAKGVYNIDSITLIKQTDTRGFTEIKLESDVVDVKASGEYGIESVSNSFYALIDHYFDIIPGTDSTHIVNDKSIDLDLVITKPEIFTEEFLLGVVLAPNTRLTSTIDFPSNYMETVLTSEKIVINDITLDTNKLAITTEGDYLIGEFSIEDLILKDSTPTDSIVLGIDNFSISSRIAKDSIIYGINWNNWNQVLKNSGDLEGYIARVNDSTIFSFGKANIFVNDIMWDIDTGNLVVMFNNRVFFKNFYIYADDSEFKLLGTIPRDESDSLVAQFKDWNLSNFDLITKPLNMDLDGSINGNLKLSLIKDNPTLISNITITDLGLNDEYLGDANIINSWDNSSNSIYIESNIIKKGNAGQGEIFKADGYYYPFEEKNNLNIDVGFDKFKIKTFEPFLSTFVNDLEGTTSGKLEIRGSSRQPIVTGFADMQRTGMRVVYLNTRYSFSNSINFVKNGIKFDNLVIYDTLGNQASIDGRLTHNYFNDPKFDITISTPGLLLFNTSEHMNDLYYGSAIASGDVKISGSPNDIDLNINLKTQRGTSVVLPMDYSVEISDKDYIIFTTKQQDTISEKNIFEIVAKKKKDQLRYNIDVNLEVTPIAEVGISLPDDMGRISARGSSNLSFGVNTEGKFSLVGDYIVKDGTFFFTIGNLVSKRFELVEGGRISWSGNPYSAQVNIKGLYKVKTSLSSMGIQRDTTASYKNKVTVECYVVLTDELLNPNIKFEIKLPDLDPDYQRAVFSELDTTNTAMMNQQMISLLVLGTFSFNNASNVSLQSSYYNVIANQLSGMLSQISENVDIGLNYKPGDNVSQEEFEVALSTQLFDDRLTIDGNFGMTYDRSDQSASNIVGDVDIGYKLTPDGQWVLKVFNHSNVNSWYNYNGWDQTSPYTQGVGIAFRKDFNSVRDLFSAKKNKKKEKKKKREELNKESIKQEDKQTDNK